MKLTKEQIEQASGRELDALVAEHVMGWTDIHGPTLAGILHGRFKDGEHLRACPAYSTSGDAMLLVLERMRELSGTLEINTGTPYLVRAIGDHYRNPSGEFLVGDSLPETVCRVCLITIIAKREAE